ncbi:flagellar biosynthetic protein FliO [soil metagenome]
MQPMANSLLMLLVVLAMIPAVLWVVKRMQTLRPAGAFRQLEVMEQLPLGTRERVVLVRVHGRVLVLGATAQQVSLLAEIDGGSLAAEVASAQPPAFASPAASFAALLGKLQKPANKP